MSSISAPEYVAPQRKCLSSTRNPASWAVGLERLALRLAQASGDRVRDISVLINLGALLAKSARFDQAEAALQEAAELARLAGTREQRAYILTNLGAPSASLGAGLAADRGDRAEANFTEALDLARALGDPAPVERLEGNLAALSGGVRPA